MLGQTLIQIVFQIFFVYIVCVKFSCISLYIEIIRGKSIKKKDVRGLWLEQMTRIKRIHS